MSVKISINNIFRIIESVGELEPKVYIVNSITKIIILYQNISIFNSLGNKKKFHECDGAVVQ